MHCRSRYHLLLPLLLLAGLLPAEELPREIRLGSGAGATVGRPYGNGVLGWIGSQGWVEEEFNNDPVKITWFAVKGFGPGVNEAFSNGNLDVAHYGDFPSLIGKSGGIKTRIIASANRGGNVYLVVPKASQAQSLQDLKGKRLALHRGRPTEIPVAMIFESLGLRHQDFRLFNLSPVDGQNAIATGSVDAQFGRDAYLMEANNTGRILWSTRGQDPHWKSTAEIFVTEDFAAKYPTTVKRILKAYLRGARFVADPANRQTLIDFWAKEQSSPAIAAKEYHGDDLKDRYSPLLDPYLIEHYQRAAAVSQRLGVIRRGLPAEEITTWFDPSFLQAALTDLGLEHFWTPLDRNGHPATP